MWLAVGPYSQPKANDLVLKLQVRYRTVGDMSCTGAVESDAADVDAVLAEVAATRITERGATPPPEYNAVCDWLAERGVPREQ